MLALATTAANSIPQKNAACVFFSCFGSISHVPFPALGPSLCRDPAAGRVNSISQGYRDSKRSFLENRACLLQSGADLSDPSAIQPPPALLPPSFACDLHLAYPPSRCDYMSSNL